jgi:hypothetical protein
MNHEQKARWCEPAGSSRDPVKLLRARSATRHGRRNHFPSPTKSSGNKAVLDSPMKQGGSYGRGNRGSSCLVQHKHLRGSCLRRVSDALMGVDRSTLTSADPSTVWLADLIEATEVVAASAEPCDPAIVKAFSHRLGSHARGQASYSNRPPWARANQKTPAFLQYGEAASCLDPISPPR